MKNSIDMSSAIPAFGKQKRQAGDLYLLNKVPYQTAWQWQQQLVSQRRQSIREASLDTDAATNRVDDLRDTLILLQHLPVYTLGHGADTRFLKFDPEQAGCEIYRTERGGEVTYHCPGQVVGYPILNLRRHRQDLHWYLRQLEEVIIRTLADYGLVGDRIPGLTGVWLEGRKVAAIGIKVSRWITMHGFALNVCPDLTGFEQIVPCGIEGKPVGSLAQFLPEISLVDVQKQLIEQFEHVFGLALHRMPLPDDLAAFDAHE